MNLLLKWLGIVLLVALQACGGSGGSSGAGQPGTETPDSVTPPQPDNDGDPEEPDPQNDPVDDPDDNSDNGENPPVTDPVVEVNAAPVLDGELPTIEILQSATVTYYLANRFSDPDDDILTFRLGDVALPSGLVMDESTGIVTGAADAVGDTVGLILTVSDPGGKSVRSNPFSIRVYRVSTDCSVFDQEETDTDVVLSLIEEAERTCIEGAITALRQRIEAGVTSADFVARELTSQIASLPQKRLHVPTLILLRLMDEINDELSGETRAQIYTQFKTTLFEIPLYSYHEIFVLAGISILSDHFADACSVDTQSLNCTSLIIRLITDENSNVLISNQAFDGWAQILKQTTEMREMDFSALLLLLNSDEPSVRQSAVDLARPLTTCCRGYQDYGFSYLDDTRKIRLLTELASVYTGEMSTAEQQEHTLAINDIIYDLSNTGYGPALLEQVDTLLFDPEEENFRLRLAYEDSYLDPAEECFRTNADAPDTVVRIRWPLGDTSTRTTCEFLFMQQDYLWSVAGPEFRQIVAGADDHISRILIFPSRAFLTTYLDRFLGKDSVSGTYIHEEIIDDQSVRTAYVYMHYNGFNAFRLYEELLAHEFAHYLLYRHLVRPDNRGLLTWHKFFNEGIPEYLSLHSGGNTTPDQTHVSRLCRRDGYPSLKVETSLVYLASNGRDRYDIFYSGIYFLMTRYPNEFRQVLSGMRNAQYQNTDGVIRVNGAIVFDFNILDIEYWGMLDSQEWCG